MSKILVSFFSASGVTKRVAEKVATAINGDLFEIEPVSKYTDEDLDWTNKQSRSSIEMNENIQPEILNKVSNLNAYDTICLAFPIWWYKEPTIIDKFLEENDMSGKEIYLFCTSGGSPVDKAVENLKASYPNLSFQTGKTCHGRETEEEILNWIN